MKIGLAYDAEAIAKLTPAQAFELGVHAVTATRCKAHVSIEPVNRVGENGEECPICAVDMGELQPKGLPIATQERYRLACSQCAHEAQGTLAEFEGARWDFVQSLGESMTVTCPSCLLGIPRA